MNNERYLKLKKDFIVLYLARNGIMTFLITLCSFGFDLSKYFKLNLQKQFLIYFLIIFLHLCIFV